MPGKAKANDWPIFTRWVCANHLGCHSAWYFVALKSLCAYPIYNFVYIWWQCDDQDSVWQPAVQGAVQGSCMCKPGFLPFQPTRPGCGCYPQTCDPPCGNNSVCMWTPEGMTCMCNCTGSLTCKLVQERSWDCVTLLQLCPAPPKFRCLVGGCNSGAYRPACNGTEVTDPPCVNCTVGGCKQGYYRPACTGQESADAQCTACAAQNCTADFYVEGTCNGSTSVDTSACLPCKVTSCKPGQYIRGRCNGQTSADTAACAQCAIKSCSPGEHVVGACNGSGVTDTSLCRACQIGGCDAGFYRPPCNGSGVQLPNCEACKSVCSEGFFLSGVCSGDSQEDVVSCVPCRSSCPALQLLTGTCDGRGREDLSCSNQVCGAGNYITGRSVCTPCHMGSFQARSNRTDCDSCEPGYYSSVRGATTCLKCFAGTFNPDAGSNTSASCRECPMGTSQPLEGQTFCALCEQGSFSPVTGSTAPCQKCPAGSFQTAVGMSFCAACPPSTFQVSLILSANLMHRIAHQARNKLNCLLFCRIHLEVPFATIAARDGATHSLARSHVCHASLASTLPCLQLSTV